MFLLLFEFQRLYWCDISNRHQVTKCNLKTTGFIDKNTISSQQLGNLPQKLHMLLMPTFGWLNAACCLSNAASLNYLWNQYSSFRKILVFSQRILWWFVHARFAMPDGVVLPFSVCDLLSPSEWIVCLYCDTFVHEIFLVNLDERTGPITMGYIATNKVFTSDQENEL